MAIKVEEKDLIDLASDNYKAVNKSNVLKFKTLDKWLFKESGIFKKEILVKKSKILFHKFKRGQIVKVDFGINIGSELSYTHYAIVLNKNDNINNNCVLVVPITSKKGKNRVSLGKLLLDAYPDTKKYNLICYANISQIRTISKTRVFEDNKKYICKSDILDIIDNEIQNMYIKNIE